MVSVQGWEYVLCSTPLHGPPSTSLFPCCLVVITPVIHPGSRGSQRWGSSVGCFAAVSLVFSLKIKVKDLISIIQHERKKKKTYYGPNDNNRRLGHIVRELAHLWKRVVLLGFVCVVVIVGVGRCGWGRKEEVVVLTVACRSDHQWRGNGHCVNFEGSR